MIKTIARDIFGMHPDQNTRQRKAVDARMAITAFIFENQKQSLKNRFSLNDVGLAFKDGNRDHSTIMHYLKTHKAFMLTNKEYQKKYNEFKILASYYGINSGIKKTFCPNIAFEIKKVKV